MFRHLNLLPSSGEWLNNTENCVNYNNVITAEVTVKLSL